MASTIKLEIVTPDRVVLSEEVEYVGVPGVMGQFGVLKNHIPYLSALSIGSLYYKKGGDTKYVFVSGGFAEVDGESITILAESAERAEEIDVERAKKAKERAERRLKEQSEEVDYARARAALMRAIERIKTKERVGM